MTATITVTQEATKPNTSTFTVKAQGRGQKAGAQDPGNAEHAYEDLTDYKESTLMYMLRCDSL